MRTRAAVAVLAAAVVGGIAAPAAHADGGYGDTTITGATVNGGKDVVIGATKAKTVKVTVKGRDDSGLYWAQTDIEGPGYGFFNTEGPCEKATACTASFIIDPRIDLMNDNAGTWYTGSWVDAVDGDFLWKERISSFKLKRAASLTVNASPEPVKKGKTLTVTGKLIRANWDTDRNSGYASQKAELQFRKKGSTAYTTVKTVTTTSGGALKTTVKASKDGYWRWTFAGTSTTGTATSSADFVDVK